MNGDGILIVGSFDTPGGGHQVVGTVFDAARVFTTIEHQNTSCWNGLFIYSQDDLEYTSTRPLIGGNSGALVLNALGEVVALHRWSFGPVAGLYHGGGSKIQKVKTVLGFNSFYGSQAINDNTIGLFRPSNALWSRDNSNGKFDGCGAEQSDGDPTKDFCYGVFGAPGKNDIAVTGDWDADANKTVTLGVYHTDQTACPNTASQCFRLSNSNFPPSTSSVIHTGPASFGYKPIVGQWVGPNPGRTKVGVFRSSTGQWQLENGNGTVDACTIDYCFDTYNEANPSDPSPSNWTRPNDLPIAGDWDGNGTITIGVFRPSNGTFYFSNTALGVGVQPLLSVSSFAVDPNVNPDYMPVVGNWTGTPGDKLGLFKSSISRWYLDNGNLSWPSCAEDQCSTLYTGTAGDNPAVFGNSIIKAN